MKAILRLTLIATIGVSTYYAIVRVAEYKADQLAGGGGYLLDHGHPEEMRAFGSLLDRLERWGQPELVRSLVEIQRAGLLWVAPGLAGGRSAIYVNALNLVRRVYVRREELLSRRLPFPDLELPDTARRTFAAVNLAGTLLHELQHHEGLQDEGATYDRELEWYRGLRETAFYQGLAGEEKRWFDWAVDSALKSGLAARRQATGPDFPDEPAL